MDATVNKCEELMNQAISEAEDFDYELIDFYKGLLAMKEILDTRIECGRDECPEAFED
jgi:hypothetical protein